MAGFCAGGAGWAFGFASGAGACGSGMCVSLRRMAGSDGTNCAGFDGVDLDGADFDWAGFDAADLDEADANIKRTLIRQDKQVQFLLAACPGGAEAETLPRPLR